MEEPKAKQNWKIFSGDFLGPVKSGLISLRKIKILPTKTYGLVTRFLIGYEYLWVLDFWVWKYRLFGSNLNHSDYFRANLLKW